MKGCTRLVFVGIAVLALSTCAAWGNITNGDFSDGLTGWMYFASDPSVAVVDASTGQLHIQVTTNYAYDSTYGMWMPQPTPTGSGVGYVAMLHDVAVNGGIVPAGADGLQFTANVQVSGAPDGNMGAGVLLQANYGGGYGEWSEFGTTGDTQLITLDLPGVGTSEVTPKIDLTASSMMDVNPTDTTSTYTIVVDATFDDFKFVPEDNQLSDVVIDIRPGDSANAINLGSNGGVPVAICSTEDFDATTEVDPLSVTLADAGLRVRGKGNKVVYGTSDVNGDGLLDLILSMDTQGLDLTPDATEAVLKGLTYDGMAFQGADSVTIVGNYTDDTTTTVPEPATIMLLVLGGAGILRRRR